MLIQETPLYSLVLQMFKNLQETDSSVNSCPGITGPQFSQNVLCIPLLGILSGALSQATQRQCIGTTVAEHAPNLETSRFCRILEKSFCLQPLPVHAYCGSRECFSASRWERLCWHKSCPCTVLSHPVASKEKTLCLWTGRMPQCSPATCLVSGSKPVQCVAKHTCITSEMVQVQWTCDAGKDAAFLIYLSISYRSQPLWGEIIYNHPLETMPSIQVHSYCGTWEGKE